MTKLQELAVVNPASVVVKPASAKSLRTQICLTSVKDKQNLSLKVQIFEQLKQKRFIELIGKTNVKVRYKR